MEQSGCSSEEAERRLVASTRIYSLLQLDLLIHYGSSGHSLLAGSAGYSKPCQLFAMRLHVKDFDSHARSCAPSPLLIGLAIYHASHSIVWKRRKTQAAGR
jgi:hypothetical protein